MLAVMTDVTMARSVCLYLDSHTCAPAETIEWNEIPCGRTLVWPPSRPRCNCIRHGSMPQSPRKGER